MVADQVIQETAGNKIKDGDVILTYARYLFHISVCFTQMFMPSQVICC